MIYGHAFRHQAVRFYPKRTYGLNDQRTSMGLADLGAPAALLVCSKAIYFESRSLFYHMVRVEMKGVLVRETGKIITRYTGSACTPEYVLNVEPALLKHLKLADTDFNIKGCREFIKSLPNLRSLTYFEMSTRCLARKHFHSTKMISSPS